MCVRVCCVCLCVCVFILCVSVCMFVNITLHYVYISFAEPNSWWFISICHRIVGHYGVLMLLKTLAYQRNIDWFVVMNKFMAVMRIKSKFFQDQEASIYILIIVIFRLLILSFLSNQFWSQIFALRVKKKNLKLALL